MVPFVYFASVCRSLWCLVSALTQVGRGGLLCRFACSVVLWGGRGAPDKYHWLVWGVLAVFRPHWVWPCSWRVCFPRLHCSGSQLLYREWALSCVHFPGLSCSGSGSRVLHKGAGSVGPASCAFPFRAAQAARRTLYRCSVTSPLPIPASVSRHAGKVRLMFLLGS